MNKARKISALIILLSVIFQIAVPSFAAVDYTDDFEGYTSTSQMFNGNIWWQQTNAATAPMELAEENDNHFISLGSATTGDSILLTKNTLFAAEQIKVSFKIRSDTAPKAVNDQCAHVLLRIGGSNKRIFDFGYSVIRYNDTALSSFTANKWYNCNMTLVRGTDANGKGALSVTFTVGDSKPISLNYTGLANNFTIELGIKSIFGRGICIDDLAIKQIESLGTSFSPNGAQQVRLNEPLRLTLDGEADLSTIIPSSVTINGNAAGNILPAEDGGWIIEPGVPLEPDTEYTVKLTGIRGAEDNLPKPDSYSFKTRKTGLAAEQDGSVWRIKNYAQTAEEAYIISVSGQEITGFETVSLESGMQQEYTIGDGEGIIALGTEFSPYEATEAVESSGALSEDYAVSFSEEQQTVTAAGKTENGAEAVAVLMLNPGSDEPDTSSTEDFLRTVSYAAVVTADADGYFSAEIPVTGTSGIYRVTAASLTQSWTDTVNIKSIKDIEYIRDTINSKPEEKVIEQLFENYGEVIAVNFPEFDALDDKSFIYSGLKLCVDERGGYTSTEEIVTDVRELTVLSMINSASSGELSGIIESYADQLDAGQLAVNKKWESTTDAIRAEAAYSAAQKGCATMNSYRKELSYELLFTVIAKSTQYSEVKELLESYYELLGLDMSIYDAQGKPAYVAKSMAGRRYTISNIKSEFDKYLQDYIKENTNIVKPTGGSGGGGGGGAWTAPAVTPEPVPTPAPAAGNEPAETFTDLSEAGWAAEQINALAARGIVSGFSDGTFRPNETVTREQFVTMLVAAAGYAAEQGATGFTDTSDTEWYSGYIYTAVRRGIIHGREDGSFGLGEALTRQDAAVILYAVAGRAADAGTIEFADGAQIAEYARPAVYALNGMGVLSGMPDGRFAPLACCTRAEAAVMIYRIAEVIV